MQQVMTNTAVTPTAKTYTGDGLLKVVIPKNAKVHIYFENAYIDKDTNETNITFGANDSDLSDLTNKVQYIKDESSGRNSNAKNIGFVFIANNNSAFGTKTEIVTYFTAEAGYNELGSITLKAFPLENIDEMREDILRKTGKNSAVEINSQSKLPYSVLVEKTANGNTKNLYSQNGLMLKTYQSDLFNNWLQTEWIDGVNGFH